MRFVVIFEDTPAMVDVRRELEPAHIDYLRKNAAEILIGGGLRDVPGGAYVGGLWVFEVASRERATELVEGDPYFVAHRRPYRLLVWGKATPERQVVL